jgi:hypothetical protein
MLFCESLMSELVVQSYSCGVNDSWLQWMASSVSLTVSITFVSRPSPSLKCPISVLAYYRIITRVVSSAQPRSGS